MDEKKELKINSNKNEALKDNKIEKPINRESRNYQEKSNFVKKPTSFDKANPKNPSSLNQPNKPKQFVKFKQKYRQGSSTFEERVISVRRITKVVKGGRRFRFSALVVVGDKNSRVGFGIGKANEVPNAIKKAIKDGRKNLITIEGLVKGTISHEYLGHHDASKVLLKPAPEGTGIIASDTVRAVVELAGIKNIYTKSLGSNTKQNAILATINALQNIKNKSYYEKIRNVTISQ